MNYRSEHTATPSADTVDAAGLLATLTRSLADCCVGKEAEIFGRYGLSAAEGHLLLMVAEQGALSPSTAAEKMHVARSRLTPLAQSLVEKGFLMRAAMKEDRRGHELKLTSAGITAARGAAQFRHEFHTRLLESFPPSDRERLIGVLEELHDRMHALRAEMNTTTQRT
jgi:DNA-binding MarR family transcriptional regulator